MDSASTDGLTDLRDRVVCLDNGPDAVNTYRGQLGTLATEAFGVETPYDMDDSAAVEQWCIQMVDRLDVDGSAAHIVAAGQAAQGALALAVRRPDLVRSLLLGDPSLPAESWFADLLHAVGVPTVVVAAVAEAGDEVPPAAQTIAGQVDNGVFVLIDGCAGQAHMHRAHSFNEWVSSFAAIAEGLAEAAGLYDLESGFDTYDAASDYQPATAP